MVDWETEHTTLLIYENERKQKKLHCLKHIFKNLHLRICSLLRERKRERERERDIAVRNTDVRGKHWLGSSSMWPDWGLNLQPRFVPWLRIEPVSFYCMGGCFTNWASWPGLSTFLFRKKLFTVDYSYNFKSYIFFPITTFLCFIFPSCY